MFPFSDTKSQCICLNSMEIFETLAGIYVVVLDCIKLKCGLFLHGTGHFDECAT